MRFLNIIVSLGILFEIQLADSSDLIQFGTSLDGAKPAEYYALADSEFPNVGPTEDLKRTQRSFWKKLFKNGFFADRECTDNCRFDAGDGTLANDNSNNDFPRPFQPFRPLQNWRPFQPLFGGNCQRCVCPDCDVNYAGDNQVPPYTNNKYGGDQQQNSYEANTNQAVQPSYSGNNGISSSNYGPVSEEKKESYGYTTQSSEPGNPTEHTNAQLQYDPDTTENNKSKTVDETVDTSKAKVPQILYQPIIYVSSQFQEHAKNLVDPKSATYDLAPKSLTTTNEQISQPEYEPLKTFPQSEINQNILPVTSNFDYSNNDFALPNPPERCRGYFHPSVPSLSTLYAVISPQQTDVNSIDCKRLLPNDDTVGPSKYTLPTNLYDSNKRQYPPLPPITLTCDDQPYRVCPELFEDYNRQLNKQNPCGVVNPGYACNPKNTFINAHLISY
ncbi:palisade [Musca autumnalis]|uniref:palisade n=1 Tax=Musca autumnalis TaxID=221902 RepID=UPI003CE7C9A5